MFNAVLQKFPTRLPHRKDGLTVSHYRATGLLSDAGTCCQQLSVCIAVYPIFVLELTVLAHAKTWPEIHRRVLWAI